MICKNNLIKFSLYSLCCSFAFNCYAFNNLPKQECSKAIKQNKRDSLLFESNQRVLKSEILKTNWLPKSFKNQEISNLNKDLLLIKSNIKLVKAIKCDADIYKMNQFLDKKIKDIRVTYYNLVQTSKEDSLNNGEKFELYNKLQGEEYEQK